ncbi:MAG: hypothetical protein Ct9H300mP1_34280 [Planctomycetaceae bacterium]|nr:MAG: hypothetical protein Ct9H300mP1_34280 [Planctomycetaceae bacterium]
MLHRPLELFGRFFQAPLQFQCHPKVVGRASVTGKRPTRPADVLGLGQPTRLFPARWRGCTRSPNRPDHRAQSRPYARIAFVKLPEFQQRVAEVVLGCGQPGSHPKHPPAALGRFGVLTHFAQHVAEVGQRPVMTGLKLDRPPERIDRIMVP